MTERARGASRWLVLASLTLVSFLLLLDDTAVALALPAIGSELGLGLSGLEWVVNAYTLPLAALMLLGGQLGDRYGHRRVFLHGLVIFVAASALAGISGNSPHAGADLLLARVLQGVGAALVAPASLSLIADAFPAGQRGLALGIWSGVTASALGLGPLLGAILTDALGWAWIFLINVPLGFVAWVAARRTLPESIAADPPRLDLAGAAAAAVALSALLLGLIEGNAYGWTSLRIVALLAISGLAAGAFALAERRAVSPLVNVTVLRRRGALGANAVILLATAVMCSLFFFLALYLQTVLGATPLSAGMQLLPLTVAIVLVSPLAGRLVDRVGARALVSAGMALLAIALLGLTRLELGWTASTLAPWLVLAGIGIGMTTTPTTAAALGRSGSDMHGIASGIFNTSRTTGLALGIAVMGAVLASGGAGTGDPAAFADGFARAVAVNAGIAAVGALVALRTLGGPDVASGDVVAPAAPQPR